MKYICKNKCQFDGRIWPSGAVLEWHREVIECPVCKGKDKKCVKCHGTGRSVPPHHFMPFNPEKEAIEADKAIEKEENELEDLRKEADKIGCGYDRRWKAVRMKFAITEYKKEKGL
jgi:hypothetical protein